MENKIKSVSIYAALGILIGFVSPFLQSNILPFLLAAVVLVAVGKTFEKKFDKEPKWWLTNGGAVFILMFILFWIISFNL